MANTLYPEFKELLLQGGANLLTGAVKIALVDSAAYTYSATHGHYSAVQSAVVSSPQVLVNKSVTNGVFDADDVIFPAVLPAGTTVEALVLYLDTGSPATSPLIAYLDDVVGLPFLANGGAAEVRFDSGPNKIFAL